MFRIRFSTLFLTILCLTAISASAQTGYIDEKTLDEPLFEFDFATFKSDTSENEISLEVYYKIYNNGLQYFKHGDEFVAEYDINVVVLGTDKSQVTGYSRERKHKVDSYREATNSASYLINQIKLQVPKGRFKIVCKLIDKLTEKVSIIEKDLHVKDLFRKEIDISDIELISRVEPIGPNISGFDKGEQKIIPFVSEGISGEADRVSFYVEIYNVLNEPKEVRIEYKITNERSKTVYKDKSSFEIAGPVTRLIKEIPMEQLVPGEYELTFNLKSAHGKKLAQRRTAFTVAWSLKALVRNDFKSAVEQLKYIATNDETEELVDTPTDMQLEAFEAFWKRHDKYPETPENESQQLYYSRIRHANIYFSVVNQDGWETDRGRIYIIFGEPDHVERYPFELSTVPYQVWYYYNLSRTFVFEDSHSTGDYYLKFPYDGKYGGLHEKFSDFE
jgi:GWxTD domain-containing protein